MLPCAMQLNILPSSECLVAWWEQSSTATGGSSSGVQHWLMTAAAVTKASEPPQRQQQQHRFSSSSVQTACSCPLSSQRQWSAGTEDTYTSNTVLAVAVFSAAIAAAALPAAAAAFCASATFALSPPHQRVTDNKRKCQPRCPIGSECKCLALKRTSLTHTVWPAQQPLQHI